jgi:plasmid stabilization system protein ParE
MRLVWARSARNDLLAARTFIALDNPVAADRQVAAIVAGLARFPHGGRPGRRAGTRELVIGRTPCLVSYRTRGEAIEILRVPHGRRQWPETL